LSGFEYKLSAIIISNECFFIAKLLNDAAWEKVESSSHLGLVSDAASESECRVKTKLERTLGTRAPLFKITNSCKSNTMHYCEKEDER
jgi:hypothetical protein